MNAKEKYGEEVEKMIQDVLHYYVSPEYLYQTWLIDIKAGNFEVQKVADSLNAFERTIMSSGDASDRRLENSIRHTKLVKLWHR